MDNNSEKLSSSSSSRKANLSEAADDIITSNTRFHSESLIDALHENQRAFHSSLNSCVENWEGLSVSQLASLASQLEQHTPRSNNTDESITKEKTPMTSQTFGQSIFQQYNKSSLSSSHSSNNHFTTSVETLYEPNSLNMAESSAKSATFPDENSFLDSGQNKRQKITYNDGLMEDGKLPAIPSNGLASAGNNLKLDQFFLNSAVQNTNGGPKATMEMTLGAAEENKFPISCFIRRGQKPVNTIPNKKMISYTKAKLKRELLNNGCQLQKQEELSRSFSLLHQSCQLFPTTLDVIRSAVQLDPHSIRRRHTVSTPSTMRHFPVLHEKGKARMVRELYSLPINIAIRHHASLDVIKFLMDAGPDVLVSRDGPENGCSLSIALRQKEVHFDLIDMILSVSQECASIADRRLNYPLHLACFAGASMDIIVRLYSACPSILKERNFNGCTPLDNARRQEKCSDKVINFLQKASLKD